MPNRAREDRKGLKKGPNRAKPNQIGTLWPTWIKRSQTDSNRARHAQIVTNGSKGCQIGPKWAKHIQIGSNGAKQGHLGPNRAKRDKIGENGPNHVQIGSNWAKEGHIGLNMIYQGQAGTIRDKLG